ncbi:MAG TPA: DEAD/DEAH box helicase, partial [Dongiaceae bacterium]|nr:DEAD/DEAH box helicase [Dongiaceae bacterium]
QTIHESKFINHTVVTPNHEENAYQPTHSFEDFHFTPVIQKNLAYIKYITPSAIQDQTIPFVLEGKDVIGLANTGTGKTAAFLLPIIEKLNKTREFESVLIMAPTRELATQIDDEFRKFSFGMKLFSVLLVGGVPLTPQLRGLARRPHVVIGTPGRIKDHIDRGTFKLERISYFVLDEADRMLDMGFVNDIRKIASMLPVDRQTLCFSATFSDGVKAIAADFMRDPEYVSVKVTETNDHIYQDVVHYDDQDHKKDLLLSLLSKEEFEKVIIFGETKYGVQRLSDMLDKSGVASRAIHGNKSQGQRNRALGDFKAAKARVLVATDVAARGLDIPNVSHVINFDIPQTYDDYVHRIGRTGRGGKTGSALTFVKKR